jgi:hypothetical protein
MTMQTVNECTIQARQSELMALLRGIGHALDKASGTTELAYLLAERRRLNAEYRALAVAAK